MFEALDELTITAVEFRIAEGCGASWATRPSIDAIDVEADPVNGQLLISIDYRRRTDRSPRNLEIVV